MPSNKNALTRYMYLDALLSDRHHYYDIHDLTKKVNERLAEDVGQDSVCQRSIEKDLNYLEFGPFSAEIERFKAGGKSCIRYSDASFSIFTKKLSSEEENILSEVLATIGQFDGLKNFEWLDGLKSKLGVAEREKIISFESNQYLEINKNLIGRLFTAISNKVVIELSYHTFRSDEEKHIMLHPYLLKQYNQRWFLIGSADKDGFILNFALDRIDNFEAKPELVYKEFQGDLSERFTDIVGVSIPKGEKPNTIFIWVDDEMFNYVRTKPLHESQKIIVEDSCYRKEYTSLQGGHFIILECIINRELISLLLSQGPGLIMLKPSSFNLDGRLTSMKEIVSEMLKYYCEERKKGS